MTSQEYIKSLKDKSNAGVILQLSLNEQELIKQVREQQDAVVKEYQEKVKNKK